MAGKTTAWHKLRHGHFFYVFPNYLMKPESCSNSMLCDRREAVVMLYVLQKTKDLHLIGSLFGHFDCISKYSCQLRSNAFCNSVSRSFRKSFGSWEMRCNSCLTSVLRRDDVMILICVPFSMPLLYKGCGLINPNRKALVWNSAEFNGLLSLFRSTRVNVHEMWRA
jgi:hypothetical protein